MLALRYEDRALESDRGGPARLLVPHLYFWKTAKWANGLHFHRGRRVRLLGAARLPRLWRSLAGAALHQ